jgi:hypothetical protein
MDQEQTIATVETKEQRLERELFMLRKAHDLLKGRLRYFLDLMGTKGRCKKCGKPVMILQVSKYVTVVFDQTLFKHKENCEARNEERGNG